MIDTGTYFQFVLALVFVIALIGLLAALVKRLGLVPGAPTRGGHRRLAIVEVLALDSRRRLALIRRDDVEHLIVLGPAGETVVEGEIAARTGFADAVTTTSYGNPISLLRRPRKPVADSAGRKHAG